MCHVVIVTITRNDLDDLQRTLDSVRKQTRPPLRHLIIDSSCTRIAHQVERMAHANNGDYFHQTPSGIYSAMNFALHLVQSDDYLLFLNAGDTFASADSIDQIASAIESWPGTWYVGGLDVVSGNSVRYSYKPSAHYATGEHYLRALRGGKAWLPHPSTIIQVGTIRQAGGFPESYKISADFALGLRVGRLNGGPKLINATLTNHYFGGLSSRHKYRSRLENARARLAINGFKGLPREGYWSLRLLIRISLDRAKALAAQGSRGERV